VVVHIVEDDAAVADALAMVIEGLNHRPVTYPDGETFFNKAEVSGNDWVIVDLGLPGMSGTDVVRTLKNLKETPSLIAISGKSRTKLVRQLRELPELRILRKPLSIDMLAAALA
jgi:DNA-binding response OmpR family regulator